MVLDLAVLDARFGVLAGIDGRAKSGAPYKRGNEQSSGLHGCSWISIGEKANKAGAYSSIKSRVKIEDIHNFEFQKIFTTTCRVV